MSPLAQNLQKKYFHPELLSLGGVALVCLSKPGKCLETAAGQQSQPDSRDTRVSCCDQLPVLKAPKCLYEAAAKPKKSDFSEPSGIKQTALNKNVPVDSSVNRVEHFLLDLSLKSGIHRKKTKKKTEGLSASRCVSVKSVQLDLAINLIFLLAIQFRLCETNVCPVVLRDNFCLLSSNSPITTLPYVSR